MKYGHLPIVVLQEKNLKELVIKLREKKKEISATFINLKMNLAPTKTYARFFS